MFNTKMKKEMISYILLTYINSNRIFTLIQSQKLQSSPPTIHCSHCSKHTQTRLRQILSEFHHMKTEKTKFPTFCTWNWRKKQILPLQEVILSNLSITFLSTRLSSTANTWTSWDSPYADKSSPFSNLLNLEKKPFLAIFNKILNGPDEENFKSCSWSEAHRHAHYHEKMAERKKWEIDRVIAVRKMHI